MKTLLIFEKRSQQRNYYANANFINYIQDKEITIVYTKMLTNYRFNYPSAKYKEYPFVKETSYSNNQDYDYHELDEEYDELIIATDYDYVGMFSADKILSQKKGINWKSKFKNISILDTNHSHSIERELSFLDISIFDNLVKEAKIKYYFDYTYNFNAQVFFKEILKKSIIGQNKHIGITKYMILSLWLIKNNDFNSHGDLLQQMSNYRGTGKFILEARDNYSIGSPASIMPIINNLNELGLLTDFYKLSLDGELFLSKLVKQTFDPDLPMRINSFQKLDLKTAYNKIDKYILSTFTKQKNKNKAL